MAKFEFQNRIGQLTTTGGKLATYPVYTHTHTHSICKVIYT